jgi:hypothetical protein
MVNIKDVARSVGTFLPSLDMYGGSVRTDPARFPRTKEGAIISILCFGAAIALVVYDSVKLYNAAMSSLTDSGFHTVTIGTDYVRFNGFFVDSETSQVINADDGRWDLPTLMVECQSNVRFYNKGARPISKVQVVDNNGIHQALSSDLASPQVAQGVYKRVSAPLGSQNRDVSMVQGTAEVAPPRLLPTAAPRPPSDRQRPPRRRTSTSSGRSGCGSSRPALTHSRHALARACIHPCLCSCPPSSVATSRCLSREEGQDVSG